MARKRYTLEAGTVQPLVAGFRNGHYTHHFGPAEYHRDLPVLPARIADQAQPIVDALNAGTMTEAEARKALDRIY